jgi:protoheme IX farnesyltransferase
MPKNKKSLESAPDGNLMNTVRNLLQLTKPTIMFLVVLGGGTSLIIEGSLLREPLKILLFFLGLFLTGGSANALNQYFEREIDSKMERTRRRRPLPTERLSPTTALVFSVSIGVIGVALLGLVFNWLTGMLALGTIAFYSLFYTLYLKPRTDQNIVIGGIAGAMAPIGAWAAATGSISAIAWIIFLVIFLWTPPHFWSLAIHCRNDYEKAGLPMYPLTRGDDTTLRHSFYYTIALIAASLLPIMTGSGWLYVSVAVVLGIQYLYKTILAMKNNPIMKPIGLFKYSLIYLPVLFIALIIDHFVPY